MEKTLFTDLGLSPQTERAVEDMGFSYATQIQAEAIPLIRSGCDVLGKSQTGTGKTVAFAIPAIEKINTGLDRQVVQVLILCPTRELAQQGCEEIRKLCKFNDGISVADVYGGAPMDRQIKRLKNANIVIGTPGRIMDHMRRRTLKLDHVKTVILDEADEMLSMGFLEDIETILEGAPEERQTVLLSATMPKEIMKLAKRFQKNPTLIEINKDQVTISQIAQSYVDVPMGRKQDALNLLLRFYKPKCTMIFCNTKKMVDELSEYLSKSGFDAVGLHGDMNQSQRTTVMNSFKHGRVSILVATDVAARGIDVNNIEYVINYDIPQNTEYYVHRIGRTGRAGKDGNALTICSGRRQVILINNIAHDVKCKINPIDIPTVDDINKNALKKTVEFVGEQIDKGVGSKYLSLVNELSLGGYSMESIAAAVMELHFGSENEIGIEDIEVKGKKKSFGGKKTGSEDFDRIIISIGRSNRVAPNHIVGAITERTNIAGKDIGKIEIYDNKTIVDISSNQSDMVIEQMIGCKICGAPVRTEKYDYNFEKSPKKKAEKGSKDPFSQNKKSNFKKKTYNKKIGKR